MAGVAGPAFADAPDESAATRPARTVTEIGSPRGLRNSMFICELLWFGGGSGSTSRRSESARNRLGRVIEYRALGPLSASSDGVSVALGGPKQRMVLAVLLVHANRVVSVDRLVDGVWGEHP